jgi:hypothetical protein
VPVTSHRYVAGALAFLAVATIPLSLTGPGWLRLLVIAVFLLAGPGTAVLLLLGWPRNGYALAVSMATAISLAVSTLVATVMLYAHQWHPGAGVIGLAALVLVALGIRRRMAVPA